MSSRRRRASSTRSSGSGAAPSASRSPTSRLPAPSLAARLALGATCAIGDALLSVLLAPACAACERLLEHPTQGCICASCWAGVVRLTPPVCERCGDPLPTWRIHAIADVCTRCRRMTRAVDRGRAAGLYDGSLRAIVHAFKYEGRRSLARPLAGLMRDGAGDLLDGVAWTIPVPLHWRRKRARGFNQAEDLARALGLPVWRALRRVRATIPQADLPAARRHRNVRDAFALTARPWSWMRGVGAHAGGGRGIPAAARRAASIARVRTGRSLVGACVLLIDDVSTTGATLDACARVLKRAGAREVRALTAARVVTRPPR